jgi:capsid protein
MARRAPTLADVSRAFRAARQDSALVPRADYDLARPSRFRRTRQGIDWTGSDADWHVRTETDRWKIVELCRDLERNDPYVGQGVGRLVANVVQGGFTLDVDTGDDEFDARVKDAWLRWADDPDACDFSGRHDWHDLERLALRRMVVDGDVLASFTSDDRLQLFEAHRLRTPTGDQKAVAGVVHGVQVDPAGRHLRYWVTHNEPSSAAALAPRALKEFARLDARDADGFRVTQLVHDPDRLSQTRGVSALCRTADTAGQHADLHFAKLVQAQITSCIGFIRERDLGALPTPTPALGSRTTETQSDGLARILETLAPGVIVDANPGERLVPFSPNVPNSEFFTHSLALLTILAVNLGLPVAVLLLDPSNTNFSGWRGAIDQARLGFSALQRTFAAQLHRPAYLWFLARLLQRDPDLGARADKLRAAGKDPFRHAWNPPTWRYIQPVDDATADILILGHGLMSPRELHAQHGREWDDVYRDTIADRAAAIRAACAEARAINGLFPEAGVSWREVCPLPQQDGLKLTVATSTPGAPAPTNPRQEAAA